VNHLAEFIQAQRARTT